jgi:serine/threonine protein kinase
MQGVAHRDINPDTIFQMSPTEFKLADFGEGMNLNYLKEYVNGDFY